MKSHARSQQGESGLHRWTHTHAFGADRTAGAERRTRWVVAVTVVMMVVEIGAGLAYGSMALLADGWHMGTHAAALGIAAFAYAYARSHASDPRYSFGTGKVGPLGGFGSAVGLAVVALLLVGESAMRLASPASIRFDEAIAVAVIGLLVNLGSAVLLGHRHDPAEEHDEHEHEHEHGHGHGHAHDHEGEHGHAHEGEREPGDVDVQHRDHNLRGAYLHVLADALTSVLAIVALLAGKALGWTWLDPVMGVVGGLVIARWSWGLLKDTSAVLLDGEVPEERRRRIRAAIEGDGEDRVADLHLWRVGPEHLAVIVSVVTGHPRPPAHYKRLLAVQADLAHVTVEVIPRD